MAQIIPFKGLLYNKEKLKNFKNIVAPPYDVISKEKQDILYNKSKYNIVRLILGKEYLKDNQEENRYTRAANYLDSWIKQEILTKDEKSSLYLYTQEYTYKSKKYTRKGFISLIKIEDYSSKAILPHEKTLSKPKEDRLKLLKECRTNFSPIFGLYSDPDYKIDAQFKKKNISPRFEILDESGITHTLSSIDDDAIINEVVKEMKDKEIFIADGHHRYETSLNYRDELLKKAKNASGETSSDFVMMYFTNMESEGMTILPYYRLICNLENFNIEEIEKKLTVDFEIEKHELKNGKNRTGHINELLKKMESLGKERPVFGMYCGNNKLLIMKLKNEDFLNSSTSDPKKVSKKMIDVELLHKLVFQDTFGMDNLSISQQKNIIYTVDEREAIDKVDEGLFQAAFLLNPTKMDSLKSKIRSGEKMPQKSTFFFPKLLTGLVINKLD